MTEWKVALVAAAVGAAVALTTLGLAAQMLQQLGPCADCAERRAAATVSQGTADGEETRDGP